MTLAPTIHSSAVGGGRLLVERGGDVPFLGVLASLLGKLTRVSPPQRANFLAAKGRAAAVDTRDSDDEWKRVGLGGRERALGANESKAWIEEGKAEGRKVAAAVSKGRSTLV